MTKLYTQLFSDYEDERKECATTSTWRCTSSDSHLYNHTTMNSRWQLQGIFQIESLELISDDETLNSNPRKAAKHDYRQWGGETFPLRHPALLVGRDGCGTQLVVSVMVGGDVTTLLKERCEMPAWPLACLRELYWRNAAQIVFGSPRCTNFFLFGCVSVWGGEEEFIIFLILDPARDR